MPSLSITAERKQTSLCPLYSVTHNSRGSGGRASVLLSSYWFNCTGLCVEVSLGKILNPKLLLMCCSAPCMAATAISVWTYVWITVSRFGKKRPLNVNVNLSRWINKITGERKNMDFVTSDKQLILLTEFLKITPDVHHKEQETSTSTLSNIKSAKWSPSPLYNRCADQKKKKKTDDQHYVSLLACGHAADSDNTAVDTTAQYHVGIPVPSLCATFSLRRRKVTRHIWPKETLSLFGTLLCYSF